LELNLNLLIYEGAFSYGLLICTLIFESQGLFQTLEKLQVLQTLIFFPVLYPEKKLGLYYKPEKRFAEPEKILGFDFPRP
jgi:hypothetical protein